MKKKSSKRPGETARPARKVSSGQASIPVSKRVYQFKITLINSKPAIWRRIQIKNCTLDELHEHIQTAMGWTNSHLHHFDIDGERYGDPDLLQDGFIDLGYHDSAEVNISRLIPSAGRRFNFLYEYDFGDDWRHEVLFEGCSEAEMGIQYPICIDGDRACPPEDIGGVWGFAEYLEAIADPEHEMHEEMLEWHGTFEPEKFAAAEATRAMRLGL